MLEKLNEINWNELGHAYGSAEDVPDLLRALISTNQEERDKAYYALYGNVFHQGTRWEASAHVLPFLYEMLEDENTPSKPKLIEYILHLAVGYPEAWLPTGVPKSIWEEHIEDEYYHYAKDCYFAAAKGEKVLLAQTYSADMTVRINAVWALAYLAYLLSSETVARIAQIASDAGSADERAGAVLTLGLIDFQKGDNAHLDLLKALFQSDELLIKICAAISILISAGFSSNNGEMLYLASLSQDEIGEVSERTPFYDGDMSSYISETLSLADEEDAEKLLPSIVKMLEGLQPTQSLSVTDAALRLICKANPDLTAPYKDINEFSPASRLVLRAIAAYGAWKMGETTFVNYSQLMRDYGYEGNYEKFKDFIIEE